MPRWPWQSITVSTVLRFGLQIGAMVEIVEEIGVQVKGVDRIELGHVDRDRRARAASGRCGSGVSI